MKRIYLKITLLIIAIAFIVVGFILEQLNQKEIIVAIIYALGFIVGGFFTLREAVAYLKDERALSVDFLMFIAAIGAFIIREYKEGAILILIFALSHILEDYAIFKSEKTFTSLLKIAPTEATLINKDGGEEVVHVHDLKIDDIIKVRVGDQVGADGIIIEGNTALDERTITGEFVPSEKGVNDLVYAGTINVTSTILVKVNKDPEETVAQNIVKFVKEAQELRTDRETLINKIEKWYVWIVIVLALFVMFVTPLLGVFERVEALYKGVIVLVVASPCAFVASVTPAILSSLSYGAKLGILIKGGVPLEKARKIDTIVFDKTGTITEGVPQVVGFESYHITHEEMLRALVSIEKESNHPLAIAIVNHFTDVKTIPVTTKEKAGMGIKGTIDGDVYLVGRFKMESCDKCRKETEQAIEDGFTIVNIAKNNMMVGIVKLRDTIRQEAYGAIQHLNESNISTHMLTGDNKQIARNVVNELKISSCASELMPEDKVNEIKKLKDAGKTVMMIGDGINDAPALAISDIGVAMGSSTDVSLEVADIVFINNQLDSADKVIHLSKRMNNVIIQNMIFSVLVIIILLLTNLFSVMSISIGVIGHEGSTILVILNSLRLLRIRKEDKDMVK